MKRFFYAKIALTNLKKNRQTCFPYLLTCIATIMMFYIMSSLSTNSALNKMRGGETMKIVLIFGSVIVGIFAVLFLLHFRYGKTPHQPCDAVGNNLYGNTLAPVWNRMRNPVFQAGFSGTSENPEDGGCDRCGSQCFYAGRNYRTFYSDLSFDLL